MQILHGVLSPKGELEAVEFSPDAAQVAAENLSPDPKRPNRKIVPVVVLLAETLTDGTVEAIGKEAFERERQGWLDRQAAEREELRRTPKPKATGGGSVDL